MTARRIIGNSHGFLIYRMVRDRFVKKTSLHAGDIRPELAM